MSNTPDSHLSGYTIRRIFTPQLVFEGIGEGADLPETEAGNLTLGWDWKAGSGHEFEVILTASIAATRPRPERVRVVLVGSFEVVGERPSVDPETFARRHAPAILFPYLRETIANLTIRGLFGALHLPPFNLQALAAAEAAPES